MYPLHSSQTQFSQDTMDFVLSGKFGPAGAVPGASRERLSNIAGLAFDLLARVQKTEKLRKLGQLSKTGETEYDSNVRLVGLMVEILKIYQYQDHEMMDSLEKKYSLLVSGISGSKA